MDTFTQGFWREYQRFLKTTLVTERPNVKTAQLSELAMQDPRQALQLLFSLDQQVIRDFQQRQPQLLAFKRMLALALTNGARIFLVGCGASARMAVQIEYLWRLQNPGSHQVCAVIAGGDIALIEAVERCEDEPNFALKHLKELHFSQHDLLIGLSAGGESPFILQAVEYAAEISKYEPWLLFCNPREDLLLRNPQHVLTSSRCQGLELVVGEMALTGSTRMQATTMMTLALLSAFFGIDEELPLLLHRLNNLPLVPLAEFAQFEVDVYRKQDYMLYQVDAPYALSVLADVTERSPTFNVPVLEHVQRELAKAYVVMHESQDTVEAWQKILGRSATYLDWPELVQTGHEYLAQFDLSLAYQSVRAQRVQPHALHKIDILERGDVLQINYLDKRIHVDVKGLSLVLRQLLLRLILVNHSTVVFGALGFYQGNIMTYVKPSNFKLVDRAVRYVLFLAKMRYDLQLDYRDVAEFVLAMRENLPAQRSIVEEVLHHFARRG